ncbi:MAG: hypothetical protein CMH92_13810 [Oceanicaulis sp.]|jgi:hypothetical protein|uniref:Uncharacterized protein n=1 Tax=Croceicoccus marinus TaxID=450378 RepID=A0A1Z1F8K6_9SPHN|nr:hypothetical protein [Croceicoccus marinus]ARU15072.1 hypothetical protein A9D14_01385 [Croceicoccus marinus]MAG07131.1 hypothetical protein [Sphingomonadaceae bacterium]MBG36871.1 hypothetical protein [Oceanicaulis sp.]|tara:strand:- start:887 stop:2458 length:1572 start_codon:yes stop_codon:yes gene_type:complete
MSGSQGRQPSDQQNEGDSIDLFISREELIARLADDVRLYDPDRQSGFERMSRERFEALALWGLPQDFRDECSPTSFWSADRERLLAVVYLKGGPGKVGLAVIARDGEGRYRPVGHQRGLPTVRAAEDMLRGNMGLSALELKPTLKPLPDQPKGTDLFSPIAEVDETALHPGFRILRDGVAQRGAKALMAELSRWVPDLDGNLARDFQTTGYSARVWEIYLSFAFREMGFRLRHDHQSPDYHLERNGIELFVEATTANAPDTRAVATTGGEPPPVPDDRWSFLEKEMTLKFGSPLHTKVGKRYWELDHVKGKPFVLAIADFHAQASMTWSHTALPIYLYGRSAAVSTGPDGREYGEEKRIDAFEKGSNQILPFFEQDGTENVSAVLFSNAGTIAKFNRMAVRAGFGDRFVTLRRSGGWNDPRPDAYEAIPFDFDVEDPAYWEGWADELELHHNPRALYPIDDALFPNIANFRIEDGEGVWRGPSPRVLFSRTVTLDLLGREINDDHQPAAGAEDAAGKASRRSP